MRRWLISAALALPVALGACDEAPRDAPALARIPLGDFCAQWLNNVLLQRDRCGGKELSAEDQRARLEVCGAHIVRGVERGVISYDGEEVTRCLLEQRQTCNDSFTTKSCGTLKGLLEPGEVCYSRHECARSLCRYDGQCPGTCAEVSPPGGRCDALPCEQGSHCNDDLICERRRPEGASCAFGAQCEEHLDCLCYENYVCELTTNAEEAQGTCADFPPEQVEGEPCAPGLFCRSDLFCLTPLGGDGVGVCKPKASPGERCAVGGDDLIWLTRGCRDAVCMLTDDPLEGVCVLVREGDPCAEARLSDGALIQLCNLETWCDEARGVCVRHPEASATLCVRP